MILNIIIEEQSIPLKLEQDFLDSAASFFEKMDADMNNGWQMGRDWIEKPNQMQRLVIAADKLLTALENNDRNLGMMMAGYIRSRAPLVTRIEMDVTGEMGHDFVEESIQPEMTATATPTPTPTPQPAGKKQLSKIEAMKQAGKEVSRVFKTGKQYKFSLYNPTTDSWEESPAIASKDEAEKMREFAFKRRFDELSQS